MDDSGKALASGGKKHSDKAAKVESALQKKVITVVKSGDVVFERTAVEGGDNVDIWRKSGKGMAYIGPKVSFPAPSGSSFNVTDYVKTDFAGFDWISASNFVGIRDVMGRKCLIFRDKTVTLEPQEISFIKTDISQRLSNEAGRKQDAQKAGGSSVEGAHYAPVRPFNLEDYKVEVVACIDLETRLPVLLQYGISGIQGGMMARTYQYQAAPASLSLPPDVQKAFANNEQRERNMTIP
ncbi:MAG: hypothetical protein QM796_08655 [Chthoniobacteraceae bacterium]